MITGIKTVSDANIHRAHTSRIAAAIKANLPLAEIAGAPPVSGVTSNMDIGIDATASTSKSSSIGFVAAGEQIYAGIRFTLTTTIRHP
jgi:hypothetical protein